MCIRDRYNSVYGLTRVCVYFVFKSIHSYCGTTTCFSTRCLLFFLHNKCLQCLYTFNRIWRSVMNVEKLYAWKFWYRFLKGSCTNNWNMRFVQVTHAISTYLYQRFKWFSIICRTCSRAVRYEIVCTLYCTSMCVNVNSAYVMCERTDNTLLGTGNY